MKSSVLMLSLFFAVLVDCAAMDARASNAALVFCSERDGDSEIYSMDADGGNVVQITFNTSEEFSAMCSPDGRRIAFVSDRDGNYEIYVINADGSGMQRLTDDSGEDLGPSWSRDGSKIAFASDRDGDREIFVMNSDGSDLQQLTFNTVADDLQDFSPDGTTIVFNSDRSGFWNIWTINADGSNPQQLTSGTGRDFMPEWSPDGTEIVFESDRHGPLELYIMDANGGNLRRLTYMYSDNHEPDWSPDGSRIVFIALQGGDFDIMLIDPDGNNLVNLTSDSPATDWSPSWQPEVIDDDSNGGGTGMLAYCNQPVSAPELHEIYATHIDGTRKQQLVEAPIGLNHHEWSPDGQQIAAVGYVDASTWSIYVFDADGTDLTRLTDTVDVLDNEPSWSPDGTRLAWGRTYPAEGDRSELWIMNNNGTDQHTINVEGDGVRWSPDGTRLLYHKELANIDIWSCDIDGANEQQLTFSAGDDIEPDWSPDGSRIIFTSTRDGNYEIYVMNADGSDQLRLTDNSVFDLSPTWSPDGTLVAFGRDVNDAGRWEVFVMDSVGDNLRRVTYSPPDRTAINPDWQPPDTTNVAVYLEQFDHTWVGNSVRLMWEVTEDAIAADFNVVALQDGSWRDVSVTSMGPRNFEALDTVPGLLDGETILYNLYAFKGSGWVLLGTESANLEPPRYSEGITSVYPNPFNPHTTVSFAVTRPQQVRIEIHDTTGRRVGTLTDAWYSAGDHQVRWNGCDAAGSEVASGIYFLRFVTNEKIATRKLVLVR